MRKLNFFVLGFVSFAIIAVLFPAPTYAVDDVFVVSSSQSGDTNFLASNGDGTFGGDPPYHQEILMRPREFDFDVRWDISFGNGLGDFDGDGDMDYVMAIGFGTGKIYIYEKTGVGNQDLVIANYADDGSGVAVLLGRGDLKHPDGLFFPPDIYPGGTGSALNAISGPPYRPVSNKEPVAVIEPEYLEVTVGEEIQFDGSNSFDEDGQIVSYEWDFGDSKTISTFDSTLPVQQPASRLSVKRTSNRLILMPKAEASG